MSNEQLILAFIDDGMVKTYAVGTTEEEARKNLFVLANHNTVSPLHEKPWVDDKGRARESHQKYIEIKSLSTCSSAEVQMAYSALQSAKLDLAEKDEQLNRQNGEYIEACHDMSVKHEADLAEKNKVIKKLKEGLNCIATVWGQDANGRPEASECATQMWKIAEQLLEEKE